MKKISIVLVMAIIFSMVLGGCTKKTENGNNNNSEIINGNEEINETPNDSKKNWKNKDVIVDGRYAFDFPYRDEDFTKKDYEVGEHIVKDDFGDCYWVNEQNEKDIKTFRIEWTKEEEAQQLSDYEKMIKDYSLKVEKINKAGMDGFLGTGADPYYKGNYLAYILLLDAERNNAYWIYIESNDTSYLNEEMINRFMNSIE